MKVKKPKNSVTLRNKKKKSSHLHLPSAVFGAAMCLPFLVLQSMNGFMYRAKMESEELTELPPEIVKQITRKEMSIPLIPMQHCMKYTRRDLDEIVIEEHTLHMPDIGPNAKASAAVDMTEVRTTISFLTKNDASKNLMTFEDFESGMEGGVTHLWLALLQQLKADKEEAEESLYDTIVVDGGMNTGFYTALTGNFGFPVHSFELQRDCFDIAQKMLMKNSKDTRRFSHMYNMGLSDKSTIMYGGEGCMPNYSVGVEEMDEDMKTKRKTPIHLIPVMTLDVFLDELETSLSYFDEQSEEDDGDEDEDEDGDEEEEGGPEKAVVPADMKKEKEYNPWVKEIAIVKLDVGGGEINALHGFSRNIFKCYNIIVDYAPKLAAEFMPIEKTNEQYRRIEGRGFEAYLLYTRAIPANKYRDAEALKLTGLQPIAEHPVLGTPMAGVEDFRVMWKIIHWESLSKLACIDHCNLWFHRVTPAPKMIVEGGKR
mmetsp:Transcript_24784/g.69591  ORF Transcript_24784/g.69591 Transcript_24784/m.69591 type:complete len:484 (+) Transcript_24784:200-1651(+)